MRGLLSFKANSIFLGFVFATTSKTLKVEEMFFSSTTKVKENCLELASQIPMTRVIPLYVSKKHSLSHHKYHIKAYVDKIFVMSLLLASNSLSEKIDIYILPLF